MDKNDFITLGDDVSDLGDNVSEHDFHENNNISFKSLHGNENLSEDEKGEEEMEIVHSQQILQNRLDKEYVKTKKDNINDHEENKQNS